MMKTLVKRNSPQGSELRSKERLLEDNLVEDRLVISAFSTPFGWMGLLGHEDELVSVFVGHSSEKSVFCSAAIPYGTSVKKGDWNPSLRALLEAYAEGETVDFRDCELRLPQMTEFRRQIIAATRQIRYGETATYGELARRVGHPGAARAAGTVMSTNRFPIVIPCHRILAAGGKLGGYTSPAGTDLKQRMLNMEGCKWRHEQ